MPPSQSECPRCEACNAALEGDVVRVREDVRVVTSTFEGHARETEMALTFAGLYCSVHCAANALSDLSAARVRDGR